MVIDEIRANISLLPKDCFRYEEIIEKMNQMVLILKPYASKDERSGRSPIIKESKQYTQLLSEVKALLKADGYYVGSS